MGSDHCFISGFMAYESSVSDLGFKEFLQIKNIVYEQESENLQTTALLLCAGLNL